MSLINNMDDVKCLGNKLPYKCFLEQWKKYFNDEFDVKDNRAVERHLRNYKLIKYVHSNNQLKNWENIHYKDWEKNKTFINYDPIDQKCICNVPIKEKFYITDIDDPNSPVIIIGSVCMTKWNLEKLSVCGICNTPIDKKNKNKLICKDCVSKKCIECRGDIDKNNQYMNKNSFVYYFEPHVPENEHYGYDPATNKEGISLCGDCKTKTHKVCRRCGTDKIGYNRKTGECYYYCYKCREINKDNYTKNQRIKELTELYGFS